MGGHGRGEGVIYDAGYPPVRRVRAGSGFSADEHEFEITPQRTALEDGARFLAKPFTPGELLEQVQRLLEA